MAKRAGDRFFNHHLPQLAHNQKGNKACNRIAQDNSWPRRLNNGGASQEQACPYRAAQCDKLNMAVFQAALELLAVLLTVHHKTSCIGRGLFITRLF
ncbi:Uncharacterised protein [Salmonella enterica subsp. enterica serovar Bovismorbificans]|uniref:Uncharacterized protein n=1 Tax=Salmonella enterica subsp. enterica serovar Bovismorbificans TaxID=58097 RepID=A0A655CI43_SALET|nr:Uncharacterised protein [Salmonella enterica subsp. enterica serovar Bovismorbificans]